MRALLALLLIGCNGGSIVETSRGLLVDPSTFGALCGTDSTVQFQAAAAALNAQGRGGIFRVSGPTGCTYTLSGSVAFSAGWPGATDAKVIVEAEPGVIVSLAGNAYVQAGFYFGLRWEVRDIVMVGARANEDPTPDTYAAIVGAGLDGKISGSTFYGIKSATNVVWIQSGNVAIERTLFGGCSTDPAALYYSSFGVVRVDSHWGAAIDDSAFTDYGQSTFGWHSRGAPAQWVIALGDAPDSGWGLGAVFQAGTIALRRTHFDEGAYAMARLVGWNPQQGWGARIGRVLIEDVNALANVVSASGGFAITNADLVEYHRTIQSVRDNGTTHTSYFLDLAGVKKLDASHSNTWIAPGAQAVIRADSALEEAWLRNVNYSSLDFPVTAEVHVE
jgi:hypothetical protein